MKQIMGKGKAKGTVLFTVVTVMMVMVVLLMTTLTLTSAANRRSYYNYFESQAQYAAQNAIDAVTYSAYNRADFHDWVVANVTEGDTDQHYINLEFVGSRIQYSSGEPIVECTIERLNSDVKWDDATSALHSRAMWKITATARVGHGRNESEATVSQYLYENFQLPAEELPERATNEATWRIWDRTRPPETTEIETGVPLASSPATLMFGNKGYANNMVNLGPIYANLSTLPLGWGNYDEIEDMNTDWHTARIDPYDAIIANNRACSIGDTIYVNNVLSTVNVRTEFQSPREGACFYGNLALRNSGYTFSSKVNSYVANDGQNYLEDNSNYVYVDGVLKTIENSGYIKIGDSSSRPVNLFCGGVNVPNVGNVMTVSGGDVCMYDPAINSRWINPDTGTALTKFVGEQIHKASSASYGNSVGGNIFCNNASLDLGGGNNTFSVAGDIVMTNPKSTLTLRSNVNVAGRVISAGTVDDQGATVTGGIQQGAAGLANASADYYGTSYTGAIPDNDHNYSLMPYFYRIDEIFEVYYRWDLRQGTDAAARAFINATSGDVLIRESIAAGHTWDVQAFDTLSGMVYVPYTTPTQTARWFIPKHPYYKPDDAIGRIVVNGVTKPLDYASFVTGLSAMSGSKKNVKIVSHDISGTDSGTTINNLYVITSSCEIDLSDSKFSNDAAFAGFFVDPSSASGMIKVGIKNACQLSGKPFYFIVNNTAYYLENDYSNPDAYCEQTGDGFKAIKSSQVQVMLDSTFACASANPMFMTTGAYAQYNSNSLSVVQNPTFPASKSELDSWPADLTDIKYAYELVPNFTVFGVEGATINCSGCNAALFNCDLAMPRTTISVGTFNFIGDQETTYREYTSSTPSTGTSYVWAIGSVMIDNLVTTNDQNALCAYIGGVGDRISVPTEVVPTGSGTSSAPLGENKNAYFQNEYTNAG